MATPLNDVLTQMRAGKEPQVVGVTLTIHSQARNEEGPVSSFYSGHSDNAWYGSGFLLYSNTPVGRPPRKTSREAFSIGTNASMKVLNNMSHTTDPALQGSWNENQSFIVKEPLAEFWNVRIDAPVRIVSGHDSQPSMTITLPEGRTSLTVELQDDNGLLRGIGRDPVVPTAKALYCVSFGAIEAQNPII